ncbi:MAG: FAD-dependent oxidoreductase [Thermodesulfobacteriota bacterium]
MERQPIKIQINDTTVEAEQGWTILQAAERAGASVPILCYGKNLPLAEACRLCLVEVEGSPRPAAACATPVADGMKVKTDTPKVLEERAAILKLMLQDHYGDCLPPCNQRCPASIDIQGKIALIARGEYMEAARLIRRTNPLPLTCGRVCPHPCESQCRRNRVDEPIAINYLKRFCSDIAYQNVDELNPVPAPPTGKRVAIVGGGPAGLTAAYFLVLNGHAPVIFEAMPQLGGMLRYGIPEYRLPKKILDREIDAIVRLGVEVRTGTALGKDFALKGLREQGFDAVFLGLGAWSNRSLGVPRENLQGVFYGTKFLADVALGKITQVGRRVAVVGGGNTAIDCARTSLRLGAETVTLYYRRSRKEMPAEKYEIDEAEREGVKIEILTLPVDLTCNDMECLTGMTFCRMELGEPDASGRATPRPVAGSETCIELDTIIAAIGQVPDLSFRDAEGLGKTLELTKWGTIQAPVMTGLTSIPGVFTAGDVMTGAATAVEAIGGGRRAAEAIDRYLRGEDLKPALHFAIFKGKLDQVDPVNFEKFPKAGRAKMPEIPVPERRGNFREVELGLTEEQARAEAVRCLSCGCQAMHDCRIRDVADAVGLRELLPTLNPTQPYGLVTDHACIVIDDNKCVVCRACERACNDYHGRYAVKVELDPVKNPALQRVHRTRINERCDSCGLCVASCPTGALSFKPLYPKPGPYPLSWSDSVCTLCPLGCRLRVGCFGDVPVEMGAPYAAPNQGHLCQRGRFELIHMRDCAERILRPMVRKDGSLVEVPYEEAMAAAAESLLRIQKADGSRALGAIGFGRAGAEEMLLLAKAARSGLGTENVDGVDPTAAKPEVGRLLHQMGLEGAMPSYPTLQAHDLFILVGSDLNTSLPLLESALHRAKAGGAKVVLFGYKRDLLASRSDLLVELSPAAAFKQILEAVQNPGGQEGLAPMLGKAQSPILLTAESALDPEAVEALQNLKSGMGQKVTLGIIPGSSCGPAHRPLGLTPGVSGLYADQMLSEAEKGGIKGMIVQTGLYPGFETPSQAVIKGLSGLQCLVLVASFKSPLLDAAHVVIPRGLGYEEEATFVAGDGSWCTGARAVAPPSGVRSGQQVLADLLGRLAGGAGITDLDAVRKEAASLLSGKQS